LRVGVIDNTPLLYYHGSDMKAVAVPILRGGTMNTIVLEVRSLTETLADAAQVMNSGRAEHEAHIGFATPELL
jgi:hypothetical protein